MKTAKGYHFYYRHPGIPIRNRARIETPEGTIEIDVRGDHGYVIGPGSVHASGAVYTPTTGWDDPPELVPVFNPAWLERPRPSLTFTVSERRTRNTTAPILERARRYLAAIPTPEIGFGSDAATLKAACRLVRGFGLADADAIDLLWAWAGSRPGWSREWIAQKVQHAHRWVLSRWGRCDDRPRA